MRYGVGFQMSDRRIYLETMGCQMNVLDSELVRGQLRALGFVSVDDASDADLVVLNTCSVRQHAEDKVYSRLGEIGRLKQQRPGMVVGVIGCMAERDHEGLSGRSMPVDFLCGPGNLHEIPTLIEQVYASRGSNVPNASSRPTALSQDRSRSVPAAQRSLEEDGIESLDLSRSATGGNVLQAYVRVQRGCDKFCTFCVVPWTRGPERSRPPAHILKEVHRLADAGTREITLLGQTVNSYTYDEAGRLVTFAELLARVHEVPGIERIRFVTSYPGDFTDDIFEAMRDLPKVCEYLHLPAQSGSDAVLQRMRRQYTVSQYFDLLDRARAIVPGIALAGDVIVGFSGETEAEHEATLQLIERAAYKNLYIFKYSPRPGTAADRRLPDDVPDEVKRRRHAEVTHLQERISFKHHQQWLGRETEVLVEGPSKAAAKARRTEGSPDPALAWRPRDQLTGRTRTDESVVFRGPDTLIGQLARVKVTASSALTLQGELIEANGP